jgi:hypothetical protein
VNPWRWVDPRVRLVRLADLQAYFVRKGWTLKPNPNPNLLRFEEKKVGKRRPLFQMIPASDESDDFRQRVMELLTTLSELEDRHPVEVLNDVLRAGERSPQASSEAKAV